MCNKWGSCSSKGTVTFALALLRESADFRDYVIVHELLHLRVKNHGRLFKAYLSIHCPDWRQFEKRSQKPGRRMTKSGRRDALVAKTRDD